MTLMRRDPFRESFWDIMRLKEPMDRLFDDSFFRPVRFWHGDGEWDLPLDMYQTDSDVVVKATIPGVNPEDIDISVSGDTLTIRGDHKEEHESKEKDYFYQERRYGSFSRSVLIPVAIDPDKAEATFENGVMTLTIPKVEPAKTKQIKVKPKAMIEGEKG
jgi:HSP20 family protein